jgi:S-adenosylmethionine:tRNA ribosyltransferase-isomerase
MRVEDFDFELPEAQIAQSPAPQRDASRLMVVDRKRQTWTHSTFRELPRHLRAGDLLVVNDAKVIPARLLGTKAATGGKVELLVVRPAAPAGSPADTASVAANALEESADAQEWLCLGQASKGLKAGTRLAFEGGVEALVLEALGGGEIRVRFVERAGATLANLLERAGRLPLPPYITRPPTADDAARYQTVYAQRGGSVAAPTAGLHFTPELFDLLARQGVGRATVTLDVGPGTFLPVRDGDIAQHKMHSERFELPEGTAQAVEQTKAAGGRVVAVGTTVVRTLEASTAESGRLVRGAGETRMFITPGFQFRQVDALLTNFHLPRSTLLMLVSAFLGREATLAAYREAVQTGYRFFSYGDAMLIA